jgi:hypothetical protein
MRRTLTLVATGLLGALTGCNKGQSPATIASEPPPLTVKSDDPEMLAATREAKSRLSEFKALIAVPQDGVTVRVPLLIEGVETFHEATLVGRKGDTLKVEITLDDSSPPIQRTYDMSEIRDWTVIKGGHRIGGFTTRVMLKKAKAKWGTLPPSLQALERSFSESGTR